jgi:RNA polymerase sigma-70 factor (ECF subfamily)
MPSLASTSRSADYTPGAPYDRVTVSRFVTTRWSLVQRASDAPLEGRAALEQLCRTYRPPVLAYVRANGYAGDVAEDLVQSFFLRFVERAFYADADARRGRFRTFLLTAVKRFLIDAAKESSRLKRGGAHKIQSLDDARDAVEAPSADGDPESAFEREWAFAVLQTALERLREEAERAGKGAWFAQVSDYVLDASGRVDYARAAEALGVRANTLAVAVHRLRQRLRELVAQEIEDTTSDRAQADEELEVLRAAFTRT